MKELPIGDGHNSDLRILVPGAGLGRLAVEIATKGYRYVQCILLYAVYAACIDVKINTLTNVCICF